MTRYAIVCTDGRMMLPDYPTAESAAEVVAAIDRTNAAGCGPHTVVEIRPCPCGKKPDADCTCPPYGSWSRLCSTTGLCDPRPDGTCRDCNQPTTDRPTCAPEPTGPKPAPDTEPNPLTTTTENLNLLDAMMRGSLPDMLAAAGRPAWMDQGACTDADPELFFPKDGVPGTKAKAICGTCPVKVDCLEYALASGERHGIWGGTSDKDRRNIRRQRRGKAARSTDPHSFTGQILRHLADHGPWEGTGTALCNHVLSPEFRSPGSIMTHLRMHGYVQVDYSGKRRMARITITTLGMDAIGRAE